MWAEPAREETSGRGHSKIGLLGQGVNRLKHRESSWVGEKDSSSGCKPEAVITQLGAESPEAGAWGQDGARVA